jgi:hypothetical protein
VVPCNIVITLLLMYNQNSTLHQYTHVQLRHKTYGELREEVLS